MTISEAISAAGGMRPNSIADATKKRWLSELDLKINKEIYATHEGDDFDPDFSGYSAETADSTVLLSPAPYDAMYVDYLCANIDLYHNDTELYANSAALFNEKYTSFTRAYNRTHMPHGVKVRYGGR